MIIRRIKNYVTSFIESRGYIIKRASHLRGVRMADAAALVHSMKKAENLRFPHDDYRIFLLSELIETSVAEGIYIIRWLHESSKA